ncbi:hypothetical protein D3C80_1603910 [compost metagenome]
MGVIAAQLPLGRQLVLEARGNVLERVVGVVAGADQQAVVVGDGRRQVVAEPERGDRGFGVPGQALLVHGLEFPGQIAAQARIQGQGQGVAAQVGVVEGAAVFMGGIEAVAELAFAAQAPAQVGMGTPQALGVHAQAQVAHGLVRGLLGDVVDQAAGAAEAVHEA